MSASTASSTSHLPMFSPLAPLSTRILSLSGFPPELKTRDIQAIFQQWEEDNGGFKIKWVDDTNALIIFNDPRTTKKAYLHTLMSPPSSLISSNGQVAKVRPYAEADAAGIIASVQNRHRSRSSISGNIPTTGSGDDASPTNQDGSASASGAPLSSSPHKRSGSINRSTGPALGHRRHQSGSNASLASASLPPKPVAAALYDAAQGGPSPARHLANAAAAEKAAAAAANGEETTHSNSGPTAVEDSEEMEVVDDAADAPSGQQTPTQRSVVAA